MGDLRGEFSVSKVNYSIDVYTLVIPPLSEKEKEKSVHAEMLASMPSRR